MAQTQDEQAALNEVMQLLESTPDTATPTGIANLVTPAANDIPAKREKLAIAIIVGGAVLNAATFIGGNYLAKALSGDSGQAALDEKKRHDLALEKYQRDYVQYQKDRTQLLAWVAKQDREKNQAFHDFKDTDQALALYNQTHRAKVALPQEPKFSDYYKPSPQQKNGELLFIGASTLALGYAAFRFL